MELFFNVPRDSNRNAFSTITRLVERKKKTAPNICISICLERIICSNMHACYTHGD